MKRILGIALCAALLVALPAVAGASGGISNWNAPATWSPGASASSAGRTALAVATNPLPFIPVTPCRVADTRGNGFTGAYGPPSIGSSAARTFVIPGKCGIPATAVAVSFNFAVWNTTSYGDFNIFPAGAAVSTVSTLNWAPGVLALANAAVIPLGTSGGITVLNESSGTVDLFFDVNGYYAGTQATGGGTFNLYTDNSFAIWGESTATSFGYGTIGRAVGGTTGIGAFGRGSQWGVYGTTQGSTAIGVYGDSTGSNGVQGVTTAGGVAGVLGSNNTATDGSHGVGGFAGGAAKVFGVQGQISSAATAGSAGVHGVGAATPSNVSYGILGEGYSTASNSAGILGFDRVRANIGSTNYINSGVRGESAGAIGVHGISNYIGMDGAAFNGSGVNTAEGLVGYGTYAFYGLAGNYGGTGAKFFVEPHPTDAAKVIHYISLEGPESGTYFRGQAKTVGGQAVIEVPDHFKMVSDTEGMTVHLTPVGHFAQIWVESSDLNQVVVNSSRDVTFNYIVHGVRRAFKDFQPVTPGDEFKPMSPQATLLPGLPAEIQKRLIAVGIYNADGTVNMSTAERLGWAQKWREQEAAEARVAAQARAAEQASPAAQAAAKAAAETGRSQTP